MRSVLGKGAAGLAVLSLTGCWLQPGFDAGNSRANTLESSLTLTNVGTLTEAWSTTASFGGTPLVANGSVFVGGLDADGTTGVEAFDLATGAPEWSADGPATDPVFGIGVEPTISGDDVWIGAFPDPAPALATNLSAHAIADGAQTASLTVNGIASHPVTAGDLVLQTSRTDPFETSTGTLIVRDGTTMAELWTAALAGPPSRPVVAGDLIYVSSGLDVQAFPLAGCGAPTCTPLWTVDLGAHRPEQTDEVVTVVAASPSGGVLVETSSTYTDPSTGRSTPTGVLDSISPEGARDWNAIVGHLTSLVVADDIVYISGYRMDGPEFEPPEAIPYFRALQNGTVVWRGDVDAEATLVYAGGVLYRGHGSTVEAYDAAGCGATTCSAVASVAVPGAVGGLSVAAGRLLVSSGTDGVGHLTAFVPE